MGPRLRAEIISPVSFWPPAVVTHDKYALRSFSAAMADAGGDNHSDPESGYSRISEFGICGAVTLNNIETQTIESRLLIHKIVLILEALIVSQRSVNSQ